MHRKLALILLGLILLIPSHSHAATAPEATIDVSLTINKDGTIKIIQQLDYDYQTKLRWYLMSQYQDLVVTGDQGEVRYSAQKDSQRSLIYTDSLSQSWRLEYLATNSIIRHNNRDQLYLKIFQEPGSTFYDLKLSLKMPADFTDLNSLQTNVYAINGVGEVYQTTDPNKTISYRLDQAGAKSILTISASWPQNYLELSSIQSLRLTLMNMELTPWVASGILLPLIGLLALLQLLLSNRRGRGHVSGELDSPPEKISPMQVGVLVNKKIFESEIVATLVDLCQRNYIVIVHKNDRFYLSQRQPLDNNLADWEKLFLQQLFASENGRITEDNLTDMTKQSLYNPIIRQAFDRVYEIISERRYFKENPHLTRARYKLFALFIYFCSIIGIVLVVVKDKTPALLLPLAGTMIVAWLIIRLSPRLSLYTQTGLENRQKWQMFANFLKKKQPYDVTSSTDTTFERYLAYAIVLGVTQEWAERFEGANRSALKPDWFISYQEQSHTQFVDDITKFASSISEVIGKMRGPLVG